MSFPRYPKYKISGVEWLGEVPEHWSISTIKRFSETITDGAHISPETENGLYHFISTRDILGEVIDFENSLRTSRQNFNYLVKMGCQPLVGDLLFSKDGTIGRTVVIDQQREFVVASSLIIIRPDKNILSVRFLNRLCQSKLIAHQVESLVKGAGLPRLSIQSLLKVVGCFPPLSEQNLIAAFLDQEITKISALVAEQQRLMELLKEKRQAVISHAVTKGLNPHVPMKPSGIDWLGEIPAHWGVKRLKHISPCLTVGIVVNPSTFIADEGLPFIYGGDIREGVIDWTNARSIAAEASAANSKTRLRVGDLLTVRVGAPGVTAVVPLECDGGNCASVMLIRQGAFNSHWLCYAMNTRIVRFQVEVVQYGAAQEQFNISHAVNFWTPTPPRAEQDEIVAVLNAETAKFDALITEAQRAIDLLQERRTALISAAVTGQIDVRNLNGELAA